MRSGPEETTMGGRPGLRYTGTTLAHGTPVDNTLVFAWDGTTQYLLNCQYSKEMVAEIRQGCDQVVRTFKIH
jgi:hypothetical protein